MPDSAGTPWAKRGLERELFAVIAKHLLTQNDQASDKTGRCRYRGENSMKCAIGILITDDVYAKCGDNPIEGNDVNTHSVIDAIRKSGWEVYPEDKRIVAMLRACQHCHDMFVPSDWPDQLIHIAGQYGIPFDVAEALPA